MQATPLDPEQTSIVAWLRVRSTPDWLRVMAILSTLVVVAVGLTAWLLTDRLVGETNEVADSTGEVLIASQQVNASMAEADTAAVSVHLAGANGDRAQRRVYEQAVERATSGLERIARLVGDDEPSHTALADIGALTTRYVGLIEAARLASIEDLPDADRLLSEANQINRAQIAPRVELLTERAQNRFNQDISSNWYSITFIVLLVALGLLVIAQIMLRRRFHRWVNLPLLLATIVMIGVLIFAGRAFATQRSALSSAESEAYDALVVSAEIQETAYRYRAIETASVLENQQDAATLAELAEVLGGEDSGLLARAVNLADSNRERSGAREVIVRWQRYLAESGGIQQVLAQGDLKIAEALTSGPANASFNGFNTSVEASLLDNREQFLGQLGQASDSLHWLRITIGVGTALAAVLAWWGYAIRIGEYR